MKYEYCVMMKGYEGEPHRIPPAYEEDECGYPDHDAPIDPEQWCRNWVQEVRVDFLRGGEIFWVARRPVGEWERYDFD